jgi:hypothetical protein
MLTSVDEYKREYLPIETARKLNGEDALERMVRLMETRGAGSHPQ